MSAVTDAVIDEVTAWQSQPLETSYAIPLASDFINRLAHKISDSLTLDNLFRTTSTCGQSLTAAPS